MEQLPKIVQQRLQGNPTAGAHPDPDLLTAFAEKSLKERERAQVLHHLAECADCRNVVSLALPELDPAHATSPARLPWLTWPVLRWGALAACMVVVGAAVTLRYERRSAMPPYLAQRPAASPPVTGVTVQREAPNRLNEKLAAKIPPPSPFESAGDFGTAGKLAKQSEGANTKSAAGAAVMDRLASAQLEDPQFHQNQEVKNELRESGTAGAVSADKPLQALGQLVASAPASPPGAKTADAKPQTEERYDKPDYTARAMTETVEVEAAPVSGLEQSAAEKAKDESRGDVSRKKVQSGRAAAMGGASLGHRKSASTYAGTASGEYDKRAEAEAKATPRWTLSAEGGVQRSFDSGKSWQSVPVTSGVVFRALAANGSDIWVGGAAGVFYHSSDAGEHWTQVKPLAKGKPLTADIVTVEFSDPRHGRLTTENREIWTTGDAGETWHKQ